MGTPRALALQRELGRARLPSGRTRRHGLSRTGTSPKCLRRVANSKPRSIAAKVRYWPSRANFILVDIGPRHKDFVRHMHVAGVLVRDRSNDPGCDGRVRITIGTREQMRKAVVAMNEALTLIRSKDSSR